MMNGETIPREPSARELWADRGFRAIANWNAEHERQVVERDALHTEQRELAYQAHRMVYESSSADSWGSLRRRSREIQARLEELRNELDPAFDQYWAEWNTRNPKPRVRGEE